MITETQLSAVSTKETPRKEKVRENDPRFQDIFTALTAALQIANPQAGNNAMVQNSGNNVGNTVTPRKSSQNQKDIARNRLEQNNPKKTDRSFSDNWQNAQENPKTNNNVSKKDDLNEVQTSRSERASLKPVASKNVEDRKPRPESNSDSKEAVVEQQEDNLDEKENMKVGDPLDKPAEPGLKEMFKALTGKELPDNISNTQDLPQDVTQQLLSLLNEQGSKIEDFLVKSGMSEASAENLLNKVEAQLEMSVQVREALKGELRHNEMKLALQTEAAATVPAMENNAESGKETSALDKTAKFSADHLARILQNQNNDANAGDKTDSSSDMPSKPEVRDSAGDILPATDKFKDSVVDILPVTDNGMEVFERTISSNQYNISSLHTSNAQDGEGDALSKIKDLSDLSASASGSSKTAANAPAHNLSADLSPKSINEIKQMLAPQEVVNRGTVEKPVINQIIEKFSLQGTGQQNEINIKLDPPNLGTVRINIVSEGDNVNTTLITENHAVKQTIESNLAQLRDAMADQGLKVQSFTVLVGGNQGQRGQNHQQQQGTANLPGTPFQESSNRQGNGEPVLTGRKKFFDKSQSISVFA